LGAQHLVAFDRALGELRVPDPDPGRWREQLAEVAQRLRDVLRRHRDAVPHYVGPLPGGGNGLRVHERVLAILRAGGLSDGLSVAGLHLLWIVVNGFSLEETPPAAQAPREPLEGDDISLVRRYFATLPGDRYPNLVAVAEHLAPADMDQRFGLLIDLYLEGLASRAGRQGLRPEA
jgi:TetR/AcrR family tetracycline transcriptional repressor